MIKLARWRTPGTWWARRTSVTPSSLPPWLSICPGLSCEQNRITFGNFPWTASIWFLISDRKLIQKLCRFDKKSSDWDWLFFWGWWHESIAKVYDTGQKIFTGRWWCHAPFIHSHIFHHHLSFSEGRAHMTGYFLNILSLEEIIR